MARKTWIVAGVAALAGLVLVISCISKPPGVVERRAKPAAASQPACGWREGGKTPDESVGANYTLDLSDLGALYPDSNGYAWNGAMSGRAGGPEVSGRLPYYFELPSLGRPLAPGKPVSGPEASLECHMSALDPNVIRTKEAQVLKDRAWALIHDAKYEEAGQVLDKALQKAPADPEAKWLIDRFRLRERWKQETPAGQAPERRQRALIVIDNEEKLIPYYKVLRFRPNWEEHEARAIGTAVRKANALDRVSPGEEVWVIARADHGKATAMKKVSPEELAVLQKLKAKISFDFKDAPITEVRKVLAASGVPMRLDKDRIEQMWGSLGNIRVTLKLNDVTVEQALNVIAKLTQLAWSATDDGVSITTAEGVSEGWQPTAGALLAKLPDKEKKVPVPLEHTDVHAEIAAYIASVSVTQQFHNPYDEKIEAEYVFPLPQNAAVNEFVMTIGDRKIRGIIREREEAEKIYREARRRGHVASLLTQERPNIFTQKVANIEPGKAIDINIRYFNTLAYVDGWYEFVFPMVVGPRYNPPGYTDGVGAVGRGKRGLSQQKTEVQYLKPGERTGHDIDLTVTVDAGVAVEEVESVNHVVTRKHESDRKVVVQLGELDRIPNKDFVLRYKVAGERTKSALLVHRDNRGGFFTLVIYPPDELRHVSRAPVEMVFVLDCSGSMNGRPIEQSKRAIERALRHMQPQDTFQIIRFSNNASQLGPAPIPATPENVRKGLKYVKSLSGGGGTQMIEGIKAALDFPHDEERLRVVLFLTDGFIGNDREIIGEVKKRVGASRLFSFGVGSSPNRFLLNRMAKLGRGAVAYLSLNDNAGAIMDRFFERTSHPALTDIEIDWGDMRATDVYPAQASDLFVGSPVIVTGRFEGDGEAVVRVKGKAAGKPCESAIAVDLGDSAASHKGLPCVWARTKIADLMDRAGWEGGGDLSAKVKEVALEYGLMSQYTAFVAVDSMSRTAGDHGTTVAMPVPVPEGVRYDTTVVD